MGSRPLDLLARDFPVDGARWEQGPGGLPFLDVNTDACHARLTPYGGQLCDWTPAGASRPVLFVSPLSVFAAGKAIRGGVPVCFPWFANHRSGDKTKPAHGFARTRMWDVDGVTRDRNGVVIVDLRLPVDAGTRAQWDGEFEAHLTLSLGTSLGMRFEVENRGVGEIAYEIALHTYFTVGDVEKVRLHGLERAGFIDKVDGMTEKVHGAEPLTLRGETDRVFLHTEAACTIDDPVLDRRIRIEKDGSLATVVWNPGAVKAAGIADVGPEAWRHFVCVETANCGVHEVRLAPGARHAMTARVQLGA